MKRFTLLLVFVLAQCLSGFATEKMERGVLFSTKFSAYPDDHDPMWHYLNIFLFLENRTDRSIRVIIDDRVLSTCMGGDDVSFSFGLRFDQDEHSGIPTVRRMHGAEIVELKPGERTYIMSDAQHVLTRTTKVDVAYRISEAAGKQFDVWSGAVQVSDSMHFRLPEDEQAPNQRPDGTPVKSPPSNPGQESGVPHP